MLRIIIVHISDIVIRSILCYVLFDFSLCQLRSDQATMAPTEMECPNYKCDLGDGGGRYKSPAMEPELALQMLTLHNQHHNQNVTGNQTNTGKKTPKYPRPEIGLEETPERWEAFVAAWGQYKLEYDL